MSDEPEGERLLLEQIDASMKALYGCTLAEFFSRAYSRGRNDKRREANRKKSRRQYGANEDATSRQRGRRPLMGRDFEVLL